MGSVGPKELVGVTPAGKQPASLKQAQGTASELILQVSLPSLLNIPALLFSLLGAPRSSVHSSWRQPPAEQSGRGAADTAWWVQPSKVTALSLVEGAPLDGAASVLWG